MKSLTIENTLSTEGLTQEQVELLKDMIEVWRAERFNAEVEKLKEEEHLKRVYNEEKRISYAKYKHNFDRLRKIQQQQ